MKNLPDNSLTDAAFGSQALFAALAELAGTFFLTLAALTVAPPLTSYAVSLTLLVFVYIIGGLSGSHLNPAVTVGLVASRRFPLGKGVAFIAAQMLGALVARLVAGHGLGTLPGNYSAGTVGAEFLGFGILMLAVVATTDKQVSKSGSGLAVGGALLAGLLVSKGILNPAVGLAMGLGATPAVWAPLLSGVVFALLFSLFERAKPATVPAQEAKPVVRLANS